MKLKEAKEILLKKKPLKGQGFDLWLSCKSQWTPKPEEVNASFEKRREKKIEC